MSIDRRNIAQAHTDDFEISDRIFDALSMLNEGRYFFIENLDKHRTLWSQGALRDLGLPSEHIDNCHDYWKTRVHPDDLEAYTNDIDQIYDAPNIATSCSTACAMPPATTSSAVLAGFVSTATEMSPRSMSRASSTTRLPRPSTAATGLGMQRTLINAIDACRRDHCKTGLIAVRVRGTAKLNELYGAEAVDNMLAEYAGRMLSITRGRSRVFRSRNAQFVVLSNIWITKHSSN